MGKIEIIEQKDFSKELLGTFTGTDLMKINDRYAKAGSRPNENSADIARRIGQNFLDRERLSIGLAIIFEYLIPKNIHACNVEQIQAWTLPESLEAGKSRKKVMLNVKFVKRNAA